MTLSIADGLSSFIGTASLERAVANAVGPVGLRAEAGLVARRASKLGVGDQVHVVDAQLCARPEVLGGGSASNSGEEDHGLLHLDGGGVVR